MDDQARYLDGNAAAGVLAEIFAFDVTGARAVCNGCQAEGVLADAHVYGLELGAILRCPGCGEPLVRMSRLDGRCWLDLRGMTVLQISTQDGAATVSGG